MRTLDHHVHSPRQVIDSTRDWSNGDVRHTCTECVLHSAETCLHRFENRAGRDNPSPYLLERLLNVGVVRRIETQVSQQTPPVARSRSQLFDQISSGIKHEELHKGEMFTTRSLGEFPKCCCGRPRLRPAGHKAPLKVDACSVLGHRSDHSHREVVRISGIRRKLNASNQASLDIGRELEAVTGDEANINHELRRALARGVHVKVVLRRASRTEENGQRLEYRSLAGVVLSHEHRQGIERCDHVAQATEVLNTNIGH